MSSEKNNQSVHDYEELWTRMTSQTEEPKIHCYYDPSDPTSVVRHIGMQRNHVIHAILWPTVFYLISLSILIITCVSRKCDFIYLCRKNEI